WPTSTPPGWLLAPAPDLPGEAVEALGHHPQVGASEEPDMDQQVVKLKRREALLPALVEWPHLLVGAPHPARDAAEHGREGVIELAVGVVDGGVDQTAARDDVARPQVAVDEGGALAVVEEPGQAAVLGGSPEPAGEFGREVGEVGLEAVAGVEHRPRLGPGVVLGQGPDVVGDGIAIGGGGGPVDPGQG